MISKRAIVVALVGVNLFLLAVLLFSSVSPPAALAQTAGRQGDFIMTTCQVHQDFDALFVIDGPGGMLHCFVPAPNRSGTLVYVTTRNLANDFRPAR